MNGLRLAVSWLSVLPVPAHRVDDRACRQAITFAPLVGALIGVLGAGVLWGLTAAGAPPLLAGLITVATWVLVTRGMHVDGLADAVDGLGCYGPPERALQVMKEGGAGPFAVVALILAVGVQAVGLASLAIAGQWPAVVLACATGRAAFVLACRQGLPAARQEGMGALVAGSQSNATVASWWMGLLALGALALAPAWWIGLIAVALAGLVLVLFTQHVRHRFGGITGDVLGAGSELSTTIVLAVCAFS